MTPRYSPTDYGLGGGALATFVLTELSVFHIINIGADAQTALVAQVVTLGTLIGGLVINRVGKHVAGAR